MRGLCMVDSPIDSRALIGLHIYYKLDRGEGRRGKQTKATPTIIMGGGIAKRATWERNKYIGKCIERVDNRAHYIAAPTTRRY